MRAPSTRYTIVTDQDVENLSSNWKFDQGHFEVRDIPGFYETSIIRPLSPELKTITANASSVRLSFKSSPELGQLFYSDLFTGLTVEIHNARNEFHAATSVPRLLDVMLAGIIEGSMSPQESTTFIDVMDIQFLYSEKVSRPLFIDLIVKLLNLEAPLHDTELVELTLDNEENLIQLRTVTKTPAHLRLEPADKTYKTEVGIVQRQSRQLQDAEYKGLSSFLPGSDLSPFMIFFDQRMEMPQTRQHGTFDTRIEGSGSHLAFSTVVEPYHNSSMRLQRRNRPECRLYAEYRLPRDYFFDKYELEQQLSGHFDLFGEHDLEKPVWQVPGWGSMLFLALNITTTTHVERQSIRVPFHSRYVNPTLEGQSVDSDLLHPQIYAVCPHDDAAFIDNPWDSFTIKQTVFGHHNSFEMLQNNYTHRLEVSAAAADLDSMDTVYMVTLATIVLGFFYVLSQILRGLTRPLAMTSQVRVQRIKVE